MFFSLLVVVIIIIIIDTCDVRANTIKGAWLLGWSILAGEVKSLDQPWIRWWSVADSGQRTVNEGPAVHSSLHNQGKAGGPTRTGSNLQCRQNCPASRGVRQRDPVFTPVSGSPPPLDIQILQRQADPDRAPAVD